MSKSQHPPETQLAKIAADLPPVGLGNVYV